MTLPKRGVIGGSTLQIKGLGAPVDIGALGVDSYEKRTDIGPARRWFEIVDVFVKFVEGHDRTFVFVLYKAACALAITIGQPGS